jgi:hypothetical protein
LRRSAAERVQPAAAMTVAARWQCKICARPGPDAGTQDAVGSAILSDMPDRRRSWKTDSQWLRLALTATGLGVSLILASAAAWKSSPVIYVGATLAFVGAYVACAVLVLPLPLPLLLSERRNRAFRRRAGAFLVEGHELRARPVADRAELSSLEAACQDWSVRAQVWLDKNARPADAAAFEHAIGPSQEILGSFDRAHNDLRLRLSWQLNVLRELPRES